MPKDFEIMHDFNDNVKVYMLAGKNDYYVPRQEEMIEIFTKNRGCYRYKTITGMGHEFPKDYDVIIKDAFNFLNI